MRTKPCWTETFLLDMVSVWLTVLLIAVFVLLLAECTDQPAHAEGFYVTGSLGTTVFTCTICKDDGTWVQTSLPNQQTMTSFSWRAGAGYRWDKWSVQAHYLNMGVSKIRALVVGDNDYNPKTHQCLNNCDNAAPFNTHDLMEGVELSVSRHWKVWEVEPFLRLGGAGMYHRLMAQFGQTTLTMHGWVPMVLVGGGLCTLGTWQVCAETSYYKGFGGGTEWSAGLPISKEAVVSLVSIKIPLGG